MAKYSDLYSILYFSMFFSPLSFYIFLFPCPAHLDIYGILELGELQWFQYEQHCNSLKLKYYFLIWLIHIFKFTSIFTI